MCDCGGLWLACSCGFSCSSIVNSVGIAVLFGTWFGCVATVCFAGLVLLACIWWLVDYFC